MRRDKIISLRQNSKLLNKVQTIIDKHTTVEEIYNHKYYKCNLGKPAFLSNKFTIADIVEEALEEFVKKHSD